MPSYYHLVWRSKYFSYGNPIIQSQDGSSSNYQEQIKEPSFEEQILSSLEETKKENGAREKRFPNMETNMEANMDANMDATFTNQVSDMCATIDRLEIQVGELTKAIKEKSSRQLLSNIKDMPYGIVET